MKKSRFSESQIVSILASHEKGQKVIDLCREHGISQTVALRLTSWSDSRNWRRSMDFMRDSLFQGKPFRAFNVIDDFNREALNITIAKSITCERVIMELEQLISWRGRPQCLRVDNGPEFIAHALEEWCKEEQIELRHIQKGSPSQNA